MKGPREAESSADHTGRTAECNPRLKTRKARATEGAETRKKAHGDGGTLDAGTAHLRLSPLFCGSGSYELPPFSGPLGIAIEATGKIQIRLFGVRHRQLNRMAVGAAFE